MCMSCCASYHFNMIFLKVYRMRELNNRLSRSCNQCLRHLLGSCNQWVATSIVVHLIKEICCSTGFLHIQIADWFVSYILMHDQKFVPRALNQIALFMPRYMFLMDIKGGIPSIDRTHQAFECYGSLQP